MPTILSDEMRRLVEKETGKTEKEIAERHAPRVSEEHEFHVRERPPVRGAVRLKVGRYYTSRYLEQKRRRAFQFDTRWGRALRWLRSWSYK